MINLATSFYFDLFKILSFFYIPLLLYIVIKLSSDYFFYKVSSYSKVNDLSFFKVRFDRGLYGEFLIYEQLEKTKSHSKVLNNLYIPTENGTTEIDIVFIHKTGIYVIESKNFNGWIFGSEDQYQWTQTFKNGKKYRFYNPIKQNQSHVKHLQNFLPDIDKDKFYSLIVFGRKTVLKKINKSDTIPVIKINSLVRTINKMSKGKAEYLSKEDIDNLYQEFKEYTNVDESIKEEHIETIAQKSKN